MQQDEAGDIEDEAVPDLREVVERLRWDTAVL